MTHICITRPQGVKMNCHCGPLVHLHTAAIFPSVYTPDMLNFTSESSFDSLLNVLCIFSNKYITFSTKLTPKSPPPNVLWQACLQGSLERPWHNWISIQELLLFLRPTHPKVSSSLIWSEGYCVSSSICHCQLLKKMIPMYRLWLQSLYGLHGSWCSLSLRRLLNLITHSPT